MLIAQLSGTGRERNQARDAGDVLALLRRCRVDVWPEELSARGADPFVRAQRGGSLAND